MSDLDKVEISPSKFFHTFFGENRLVSDEVAKSHNEKVIEAINFLKQKFDLEDSDFISFVVGSGRTIPSKGSDVDLFLIFNSEKVHQAKFQYIKASGQEFLLSSNTGLEVVQIVESREIHDTLLNLIDNLYLASMFSDIYGNILLTPDKFIFGNITLLQEFRELLIKKVQLLGIENDFWGDIIYSYFIKRLKNWNRDRSTKNGINEKEGRKQRFNEAVEKAINDLIVKYSESHSRKEAFEIGIKWFRNFVTLMDRTTLPSWKEYVEYMEKNQYLIKV